MNNECRVVRFEFPIKPISLNAMYRSVRGRTILSEAGREFKNYITLATKVQCVTGVMNGYDQTGINAEVLFCAPDFITKKGELSKTGGDLDNLFKALCDSIFGVLDINDAHITEIKLSKKYSSLPITYVTLSFPVLK